MLPSPKDTELPVASSPDIRWEPAVFTVKEVARELRCSKAHVHNLINGKVHGAPPLPSISVGRRRLVRKESLQQWIELNEHTPR